MKLKTKCTLLVLIFIGHLLPLDVTTNLFSLLCQKYIYGSCVRTNTQNATEICKTPQILVFLIPPKAKMRKVFKKYIFRYSLPLKITLSPI